MKKRNLLISSFALLTLFSATSSVGAWEKWSPSEEWTSAKGSYSPYYGNTALREYSGTRNEAFLTTMVRFKFTNKVVDEIQDMKDDDYFYTMDISVNDDEDTTVNAYFVWSDLPGGIEDRDDNPEFQDRPTNPGNGFFDESEVVCSEPGDLESETDYRMETSWNVHKRTGTTFEFTSQKSEYWDSTGEYNTYKHERHLKRKFPW